MKTPLKTFEPNLIGRDFVIGDLHGAFELFTKVCHNINFDPTKDRMFSVGDLIDRGPESKECLSLLKEPWFHPVLANHEQLMIEAFAGGYLGQFWTVNGGTWGYQALTDYRMQPHTAAPVESQEVWKLVELARELPWLITVKMKNGKRFHVIHAELPPGHEITDELLEDPKAVQALSEIETRDGSFLCWGRHIFGRLFNMDIANHFSKVKRIVANTSSLTPRSNGAPGLFSDKLSHVISGHTIMLHPITVLGQTNIDTCAYEALLPENSRTGWEALTCVELESWTFYQQRADDFRTIDPLVVNTADILAIQGKPASALDDALGHGEGLADRSI